ncbi:SusC/RagA family TonB-linked outer membrane protein [Tellurirhabdus bombi]|uniref:SusC/RagA family TonB-linked outer membrane protein n=1 Tax=Tellurirhabdus bombi TaxID=2907205 RepID=UPI001F18D093|nr:TonB-dependent receptor [Tellurirhabdus bombi]
MVNFLRTAGTALLSAFVVHTQAVSQNQSLLALGTARPQTSLRVSAQEITVTGTVKGDNGEALPGVSIVLKGTTTGTTSDVNGRYRISIPDGNGTLVFSFIGYTTQELPVNNRSALDVQLETDTKSLNEVVVVGYGAVKRSDVTGSLASVSSKQIEQVPVQSLSQALQGRAAGVDVATSSFRPGDNPTIRIRGNRSLQASNDPLYVVDGIPAGPGTSIADFNPLDVESVEVLKDASAAAIYGSRGANGVILVTTKRGKAGSVNFNYDGYVGFEGPLTKLENFNASELAEVRREGYRAVNAYSTLYPNPVDDRTLFGADPFGLQSIDMGYEWDNYAQRIPKYRPTTAEEKALYGVDQVPIYNAANVRNTDWADIALRTGITQSHQLSVSGGSEKLRALFSGGYFSQKGIQESQDFNRYNARLNLDYKINNYVSVGASTNLTYSVQNLGVDMYSKALGQLPFAIPYDTTGNYIFLPGGDIGIINPILDPGLVTSERRATRFFGSFYLEAQPIKGLRYRLNFGPDLRSNRTGNFQAGRSSFRQGGTSYARYQQEQRLAYTLENLLYYDKSFGAKHSIGLTLLHSISSNRYEGSDITVSNLPYDSQKFYNVGSTYNANPDGYSTGYSLTKLMSWMGRVNYTLLNKYLFTATARYDGASVLAEGNKWDLFPSFAFAWKLQEESFLKNISAINELKVRVGYGSTGNSAINAYQTGGFLNRTAYIWGDTPAYGYAPATDGLPNPNLKWERTNSINAGIDFGILNNRISGSIDAYQANTRDLIMSRQIPTASGFSSILTNIGATRNSGIELTLSTVNIERPGGFQWKTDWVFMTNKEQIVELSSGKNDLVGNRWFIGQPINVFYDYQFDGIFQNNEADQALIALYKAKAPNSTFAPGKIKVRDMNGDSLINLNDMTILGSTVPKWSGSLTNTFSYKGFEFSFLVFARIGQLMQSNAYRPGLSGRYPFMKVNYWTPTNPSNEFPRPNKNFDIQEFATSMTYPSTSFVRVRSISLSYSVPRDILGRYRINNMNVYVNAVNPFLFTNFKALDPEGGDLSTRSIVLGLRFGF